MSKILPENNYKIFRLIDGSFMMGKLVSKDSTGVVLNKPTFIKHNDEMIYFTEAFDGLSDSENHYFMFSNLLTSGKPMDSLLVLYRTYIGEISEEECEEILEEVYSEDYQDNGQSNNDLTIH